MKNRVTETHRMGSDTRLTPPAILRALGPFDLDPACPPVMPRRTAATMLTKADDSLSRRWAGRVWLNPPYGDGGPKWIARLAHHGRGTALLACRTEAAWFQEHVLARADAVFFFAGRLRFALPDGSPAPYTAQHPSCLAIYGPQDVSAARKSGLAGKLIALKPVDSGDAPSS